MSKYSGISYNINNTGGINLADKIVTIHGAHYNLVDAHNIDWNGSILTYMSSGLIGDISGFTGKNKERYADEENSSYKPYWYSEISTVNTTGELLDIVDYLSYSCNYLKNELSTLLRQVNGIVPVLYVDSNEMSTFGAQLEDNGDVSEMAPISFTLKPNQTNDKFVPNIYKEVERRSISFKLFAKTTAGLPIGSDFFDTAKLNVVYDNKNDALNANITTQYFPDINNPETPAGWLINVEIKGWGRTDISNDRDKTELKFRVTLSTNGFGDKYNASQKLILWFRVKKDENTIKSLKIDKTEFLVLPYEFFKGNSACVERIENKFSVESEGKHILNFEPLLVYPKSNFAQNYDFDNLNPSYFNDDDIFNDVKCINYTGTEEVIQKNCAFSTDKARSEANPLTIQVYSKYYGEDNWIELNKDKNGKYLSCGAYDISDNLDNNRDENTDLTLVCRNYTESNDSLSKGLNITIKPTDLNNYIIDKNDNRYLGFTVTNVNNFEKDTNQPVKCIKIDMTSTRYVAKNLLRFYICPTNINPVLFTDGNKKIFDTSDKAWTINGSLQTEDKEPTQQPKNSSELINSSSYPQSMRLKESKITFEDGVYVWRVTMPIFTVRSWGNKAQSNNWEAIISNKINPSTLGIGTNSELQKPSNDFEIKSNYEFTQGLNRIPMGARTAKDTNYGFLINALHKWYTNNDANYEGHIESLIDKLIIDFEKTFTDANNKQFIDEANDKELSSKQDLAQKGEYLCSKYFYFDMQKDGVGNNKNIYCYIILKHPTINIKNENVPFVCWFKIPENNTRRDSAYIETHIKVYLKIERADYQLIGWAKKSKSGLNYIEPVKISFNTPVNITQLIKTVKFEPTSKHEVQTRLSSVPQLFGIKSNVADKDLKYGSNNLISNTLAINNETNINYQYAFNDNNFIIYAVNEASSYYKYVIDEPVQFKLPIKMLSDNWFNGCENQYEANNIDFVVYKQQNNSLDVVQKVELNEKHTCTELFWSETTTIGLKTNDGTIYNGLQCLFANKNPQPGGGISPYWNFTEGNTFDIKQFFAAKSDFISVFGDDGWKKLKYIVNMSSATGLNARDWNSEFHSLWTLITESDSIDDIINEDGDKINELKYNRYYDSKTAENNQPITDILSISDDGVMTFNSNMNSVISGNSYIRMIINVILPMTNTYRGLNYRFKIELQIP